MSSMTRVLRGSMIKSTAHSLAAQSLEVVNPFENTSGNPERRARKPAQATVCGLGFWTKVCGPGGLSIARQAGSTCRKCACDDGEVAGRWRVVESGSLRCFLTGTKSPGLVVHA